MTSSKASARRWGSSGVAGASLLVYGVTGAAALSGILALGACQRDARPEAAVPEKTATIRVVEGNGLLAGGEEYEIAEWRSGAQAPGGGAFADFRGQDGGPTLDLSLKGLGAQGEFACGETLAATLELRVDVDNAYRAAHGAACRVAVERADGGVIEGRYTATLRHTANSADEVTVEGTFRATRPGAPADADIKAAQGPKLGVR